MSITLFNDFMTATDQTVLSGPDKLINEAVARSYFIRELVRGRPYTEMVQGGKTITDQIMFDDQSTYDQVSPNQVFQWKNPQVLDEWSINWRFGMDHMSWTDQEIELQVPSGLNRGARARIYKRIKSVKERRLATSLVNGLEAELWAFPRADQMEAATGKAPYSIPAHVNEEANGLYPGWSTKQSINPGAGGESKWRPQVVNYDYTGQTIAELDALSTNLKNPELIQAFDRMHLLVGRDELPIYPGMGESRTNASMIVTSRDGENYYRQVLRYGNDTHVMPSRQDPAYMNVAYAGIPLVHVEALSTAPLYAPASGTTYLPEGGALDNVGFRYYWINRKYLRPVFHTRRYMFKHPVRTHPNQPSTHVQVVDCWHNYPVNSLQRHGMVAPLNS